MDCTNRVPFCKALCHTCNFIGKEENCPHFNNDYDIHKGNIPTFAQYYDIIETKFNERKIQLGLIQPKYSYTFIRSLKKFQRVMNYSDDTKIDVVNAETIKEFAIKLTTLPRSQTGTSNRDLDKPITMHSAKGDIEVLQIAFGKWIRNEIKNDWNIPVVDMPDFLKKINAPRYQEKSNDIKMKVAIWYRSLVNRGRGVYKNKDRLFTMMMYKYAMRNGDVTRLKYGENFIFENGKCRLVYTPRKTKNSSKSIVKVFMHPMDSYDLMQFKNTHNHTDNDFIFGGGHCLELMERLNNELRELGFTGSKRLYELRKLCIDAILKKLGPLYASAISGDNFETVQYFYSDPRSLNFTGLSDDDYVSLY